MELKPCPFCGEIPIEIIHHIEPMTIDGQRIESRSVVCKNRFKGCMGQGNICPSENEAIKAWNTRAEPKKEMKSPNQQK